jgi:hypothetical protein
MMRGARGVAQVNNDLPNNLFGGQKKSVRAESRDVGRALASNARWRAAKARRATRAAAEPLRHASFRDKLPEVCAARWRDAPG